MARFSALHIDVLEVITSKIHVNDLGNLWLTGDQRLQVSLRNGGVKSFDWPMLGSKWPSMISSFGSLTELSLVAVSEMNNPYFLEPKISELPATLRVLRLGFLGAFRALFGIGVDQNLSLRFPCLTDLEIIDPDWSLAQVGDAWVELLPKVLKHLSLVTSAKLDLEAIRKLPRSLIWLKGTFNLPEDGLGIEFPPYLQHLHMLEEVPDTCIASLPRTLLELDVFTPYTGNTDCWMDYAKHLPPNLRFLSLRNGFFDNFTLHLMPCYNTLETLVIRWFDLDEPGTSFRLALSELPPTLTRFKILEELGKNYSSPQLLSLLPKAIKSWDGYRLYHCVTSDADVDRSAQEDEMLWTIPEGLETLDLDQLDCTVGALLPQSLKELSANIYISPTGNENPNPLKEKLQSLRKLDISSLSNVPDWIPPSLTSMRLIGKASSLDLCNMLSALPNLVSLILEFDNLHTNISFWTSLNNKLELLRLYFKSITSLDQIDRFPSRLTSLHLSVKDLNCGALSDGHLALLPNTLTLLEYHGDHQFTVAGISKLPRGLLELKLSGQERIEESASAEELIEACPPFVTWFITWSLTLSMGLRRKKHFKRLGVGI